jgi:hypothetical protein
MRPPLSRPERILARLLPVVALAAAVGWSTEAAGQLTDEQLVSRSTFIVRGIVPNMTSAWNIDATQVTTTIEVDIENTLKGTPPSPIQLHLLGGTADSITMNVYEAPSFTGGEEVILFLRENTEGFFPITGSEEGKLLVFLDPMTNVKMVTGPGRSPVPLSQFESDIAAIVAAQAPVGGQIAAPPDLPEIPD